MQDDYNSAAIYTITDGGQTWADTLLVNTVTTDSAGVEIQFIDANFDSGQTWFLVYSEYNGNNCTARRYFEIHIVDNTFYVDIQPAAVSDCNSLSGHVWTNADNIESDQTFAVPFTVDMYKAQSLLVRQWVFTGTTSVSGTGYSGTPVYANVAGSSDNSHATWALTSSGSTFTLTVTVTDPGTEYEHDPDPDDAVTFNISITGPPTEDATVTLSITSAYAVSRVSGGIYLVTTDDNGSGNFTQVKTLWGIPNTSYVSVSP